MKKIKVIVNLINKHGKTGLFFLAALCFLSLQDLSAQVIPKPKEKPSPSPRVRPPDRVETQPLPEPPEEAKKVAVNDSYTPAEKSIQTESKVSINLCVRSGNVKINGWEREEIRAYIEKGSQVGFKILQTNPKNKKPAWIKILGYDPQKNKEIKPEECLSGGEIEIDVPRNSIINLTSQRSRIKIESVGRVAVTNLGGGIVLNGIANGVEATTFRGDLTVENSSGKMVLSNADGNIVALGVSPSEIGDDFKAKTSSGRITLKDVEHRLIETNSTTGSTSFDGELLSGGQYKFTATNGSIVLAVPSDAACKINAVFGFGAFSSDLPLQNTLKKEQSLSAQLGESDGSCSLNMTTANGVIRIHKRASVESDKTRLGVNKNNRPASVQTTGRFNFRTTANVNFNTTTTVTVGNRKAAPKKIKKRRR